MIICVNFLEKFKMAENKENPNYKHIVRIANVDIPGEKKLGIALTKIKGVGKNFAHAICMASGVDKTSKTGNLSNDDISKLNKTTETLENIPNWLFNRKRDFETGDDKHILTGTLTFTKENDLKKLKKMKSYKGLRHQRGLTVRGQRTRSNFRRNKGKVVGVKKKGPQGKK
jgi:small subunit ribosomal protein S13